MERRRSDVGDACVALKAGDVANLHLNFFFF